MFEELFLNAKEIQPKSERVLAAARILKIQEGQKTVKILDDKKLRREYLMKKYG